MKWLKLVYLVTIFTLTGTLAPASPNNTVKKKFFILANDKNKMFFYEKSNFYTSFQKANPNYDCRKIFISSPINTQELIGLAEMLAQNLISYKKSNIETLFFVEGMGTLLIALVSQLLDLNCTKSNVFTVDNNNSELRNYMDKLKEVFVERKTRIFTTITKNFSLNEKSFPKDMKKASYGFYSIKNQASTIQPLSFIKEVYSMGMPGDDFIIEYRMGVIKRVTNLWSTTEKIFGDKIRYQHDEQIIQVNMTIPEKTNCFFNKKPSPHQILNKLGKHLFDIPYGYLGTSNKYTQYMLNFPVLTSDEPTLIPLKDLDTNQTNTSSSLQV